MTNRDDSEQLAWDFDAPESDGSSAAVVADEGLASLTPGSERWIAALQPTDADAMRLDKVDVASMSAEAAARPDTVAASARSALPPSAARRAHRAPGSA